MDPEHADLAIRDSLVHSEMISDDVNQHPIAAIGQLAGPAVGCDLDPYRPVRGRGSDVRVTEPGKGRVGHPGQASEGVGVYACGSFESWR